MLSEWTFVDALFHVCNVHSSKRQQVCNVFDWFEGFTKGQSTTKSISIIINAEFCLALLSSPLLRSEISKVVVINTHLFHCRKNSIQSRVCNLHNANHYYPNFKVFHRKNLPKMFKYWNSSRFHKCFLFRHSSWCYNSAKWFANLRGRRENSGQTSKFIIFCWKSQLDAINVAQENLNWP